MFLKNFWVYFSKSETFPNNLPSISSPTRESVPLSITKSILEIFLKKILIFLIRVFLGIFVSQNRKHSPIIPPPLKSHPMRISHISQSNPRKFTTSFSESLIPSTVSLPDKATTLYTPSSPTTTTDAVMTAVVLPRWGHRSHYL